MIIVNERLFQPWNFIFWAVIWTLFLEMSSNKEKNYSNNSNNFLVIIRIIRIIRIIFKKSQNVHNLQFLHRNTSALWLLLNFNATCMLKTVKSVNKSRILQNFLNYLNIPGFKEIGSARTWFRCKIMLNCFSSFEIN